MFPQIQQPRRKTTTDKIGFRRRIVYNENSYIREGQQPAKLSQHNPLRCFSIEHQQQYVLCNMNNLKRNSDYFLTDEENPCSKAKSCSFQEENKWFRYKCTNQGNQPISIKPVTTSIANEIQNVENQQAKNTIAYGEFIRIKSRLLQMQTIKISH